MKMQTATESEKQEMKIESIYLTRRAKSLVARRTVAPSPREYTAKELAKIADDNDVAIAAGNYKTWPQILAGISEEYGLSI